MPRNTLSPEARLVRQIEPEPNSGCWLWTGAGTEGDPHTWFLGADVVYDRPGAAVATDPNKPEVEADAATLGLRVLHETTHDHFQPQDWINHAHDGGAHA